LTANTAEAIARQSVVFDDIAADFTLRNMAVIADRLKPAEFDNLSPETRDQVATVIDTAHELAPLANEDLEQYPDETTVDHQYRINIWQPIHSLQKKVHIGEFDPNNSREMVQLRLGVEAAGIAFELVLLETKDIAEIAETEGYFWGNVTAAARRVKQARAEGD
jgi:hypothetical protein